MKKHIPLLKGMHQKQYGINMVDLMMWLVIAALLLAAAIQSIGYYQQSAYVYQMRSAVDVAASRIMALSANDGSVDPSDADTVVAEENAATPNDGITLSVETIALTAAAEPSDDYGFQLSSVTTATTVNAGQTFYIKATNPAAASSDVVYFFKDTATNKAGIGLSKKESGGSGNTNSFNTLTWTKKTSTGAGWVNGASSASASADGSKILVGNTNQGRLYLSNNSGDSWTQLTSAGLNSWLATAMTPSGNVMLAGTDMSPYGLRKSVDGGATWTILNGTTTQLWGGITVSDDGTKIAAIDKSMNGAIWTSADSGATWTKRIVDVGTWTSIDSSADGTKLVAVKFGGHIFTSVDSGATWQQRTTTSRNYNSVASSADGTTLITANYSNSGYVYTSSNGGATWKEQTTLGVGRWTSVATSADGTKLAVARENGTIRVSTDAGATWKEQTAAGTATWFAVLSSADGTKLFAAPSNDGYVWSGIWG